MKKLIIVVIAFFLGSLTLLAASPSRAQDAGPLIDKLIKKGILSPQEGKQILEEMKEQSIKEKNSIRHEAEKAARETAKKEVVAGAGQLPAWIKNTKFKGDFRFRYQYEDRDNDSKPSRDRYRIRWRLGAINKINEQWEAGFGLATGGTDPRSTNQTLENTFQSPDVRIDYAYARYSPFKFISIVGGKFKNPIWGPKDLLWDTDIRPDGISAHLKYKVEPVEIFLTPAYFILDEYKKDKDDPAMWLIQAGIKVNIFNGKYLKLAGTYYDFSNLTGNKFDHSAGSNTVDAAGNLTEDYDSFAADLEFGAKLPGPVPFVALFGQYVTSDANDDNNGWLVGTKIGHKKVKKLGQWQLKYNYRRLEKDAWPDFLPDSDFYGGATNAKGNEIEFNLGLAKNVTLGMDYYFDVKPIDGNTDDKEKVLQLDLVLKW